MPRAILAYYYGIVSTIFEYETCVLPPLVIDAPKQQEQDKTNYPKILKFVVENQPNYSQLILGVVDDAGIQLNGKHIVLSDKRSLLRNVEYKAVRDEIDGFIAQTYFYE